MYNIHIHIYMFLIYNIFIINDMYVIFRIYYIFKLFLIIYIMHNIYDIYIYMIYDKPYIYIIIHTYICNIDPGVHRMWKTEQQH